jgi:hypothetical protein
MEKITIFLDVLVAILSLWILIKLTGHGGFVGQSFAKIGYGTIIIGLSQIVETIGINFIDIDVQTVEFVYRVFLLMGITFIAMGIKNLMTKQ